MPVSCSSIRSTARWVLPVLVGPRTAVIDDPSGMPAESVVPPGRIPAAFLARGARGRSVLRDRADLHRAEPPDVLVLRRPARRLAGDHVVGARIGAPEE